MTKHKKLIIVFTRNPELGKVKTRLAKTIGDESALDVYKFLLKHTAQTTRHIDSDKAVYYSVKIRDNDIWDPSIYQKHLQLGDDLGLRMLNAFQKAFQEDYEKVLIVGSDLFDLKPKHINEAFQQLENNDVVIGPAQDGGYYLLGMKSLYSQVFKDKTWGTETVLKDTLHNLHNNSVHLLETLNDIDTYEDLKSNKELKKIFNL